MESTLQFHDVVPLKQPFTLELYTCNNPLSRDWTKMAIRDKTILSTILCVCTYIYYLEGDFQGFH